MQHIFGNKAKLVGYKEAAGFSWYGGGKDLLKGFAGAGKALLEIVPKAIPYVAAAPVIAGGALGYAASEATSPSGEDKEEAMKHLEEQALLQFHADIERQRQLRDFAKQRILGKLKGKAEA